LKPQCRIQEHTGSPSLSQLTVLTMRQSAYGNARGQRIRLTSRNDQFLCPERPKFIVCGITPIEFSPREVVQPDAPLGGAVHNHRVLLNRIEVVYVREGNLPNIRHLQHGSRVYEASKPD
jgi:hypothetical protein